MFDTTVQAAALEVTGADDHVLLSIIIGLGLPTPQGVVQIPAGAIRVPMGREPALKHGQELLDAGEQVVEAPAAGDIIIAPDMAGVDRAAKMAKQFRTPGS